MFRKRQTLEFGCTNARSNGLLRHLKLKDSVRSNLASGKRKLLNDVSLQSARNQDLSDLDVVKPGLLQIRSDHSNGLSLKIRAQICNGCGTQ